MIGHQSFPIGYQQYPMNALPQAQQFQQQQLQQMAQFQQTQAPQQQSQRICLAVSSEDEVNRYPVTPGSTITFIVEGKQLVMEKNLASQFEAPKIKRFRLVEEDAPVVVDEKPDYALKSDLEKIEEEIAALREAIPKRPVKKEVKDE